MAPLPNSRCSTKRERLLVPVTLRVHAPAVVVRRQFHWGRWRGRARRQRAVPHGGDAVLHRGSVSHRHGAESAADVGLHPPTAPMLLLLRFIPGSMAALRTPLIAAAFPP